MFKYPSRPLIVLLLSLLVSITPCARAATGAGASARQEKDSSKEKKDKKEKKDDKDDKAKPTKAEREYQKIKNEVSQEGERWGGGHGVFTFSLLEAFRGAADTNRDNLITAGELFAYVRDRVRVETAFSQNPTALPGLNSNLTLAIVAKK